MVELSRIKESQVSSVSERPPIANNFTLIKRRCLRRRRQSRKPQLRRVRAVSVVKQFQVRMKLFSVMAAASNGYTVIAPALPL